MKEFLRNGKIVTAQTDPQKAKALARLSKAMISSAKRLRLSIDTSPAILSIAHNALRQNLHAPCLAQGGRVYPLKESTTHAKNSVRIA